MMYSMQFLFGVAIAFGCYALGFARGRRPASRHWRRLTLLPRAVRVSHYRRKLESEQHAQWASNLLVIDDPETGRAKRIDENGEAYYLVCDRRAIGQESEGVLPFRPAPGWSEDPIDGFPYPPVGTDEPIVIHDTDIQPDGLDAGPWHGPRG